MNIALIFSGGTGQRMNSKTLPKQFLELHGKPIIIYTLEMFEQTPEIDAIVVVCLDGWHEYLQNLLPRFNIKKVQAIVSGGATGQDSIANGIKKAQELYTEDTIVLIHDGVRPLIDRVTIQACIQTTKKEGSAITVAPVTETVAIVNDNAETIITIVERKNCYTAKAPQCFFLKDLIRAEKKAAEDGRHDFIDTATMMNHYGFPLHIVNGSSKNIKITNPTDFYIFRAIEDAIENSQIFGL